nr:MBOAT family protein [Bacteroidota bacterium]
MLFNSLDFLVFFPVVFLAYYIIPHKYRWILLLTASWYFYASFRFEYLYLIFVTSVSGYLSALFIEKSDRPFIRKTWLVINLTIILGMLVYFKYYQLLIDPINQAFESLQSGMGFPVINVILPVGISFYTFQVIGYTLDVYWQKTKAEHHAGIFALYVAFFPQLVAGPIERANHLIPQFRQKHNFNYEQVKNGLFLILWGYFQKVAIADKIAKAVDPVFAEPAEYGGYQLLLCMVLFTFQIYCDFAGYTNIALGTAKTLGFDLMDNFNRPFISKNISEFWRRWHISLSTWARDYLFMPVSYSRRNWGRFSTIYAVAVTFMFLGIWHGANWIYLIFGLSMGLAFYYELITVDFRLKMAKKTPKWLYNSASMLLTFSFITILFLMFRLQSFGDAINYIKILSGNFAFKWVPLMIGEPDFIVLLACIVMMELFQYAAGIEKKEDWLNRRPIAIRWAIYLMLGFIILNFGVFNQNEFIYFQF